MSKKTSLMDRLMIYIERTDIVEYSTLLDWLADGGSETLDLYEFACDEVLLVTAYLDSLRRGRGDVSCL